MAETRESAIPIQRVPSWGRAVRVARAARAGGLAKLGGSRPHLLLALAFLIGYGLLALVRYERFGSPSWDLGIFTEVVKGYAHLHAPVVSIKGQGFNALGDHWSPILALLAPAFWLVPSAATLLLAQAALFAWSVGVVSDTAARVLGGSTSRGLLIGTAYGLSWGLQRAIDAEFHEIAFAVPLLALVCRQILLGNWERAAWWAMPLVLVKEDLGLTAAAVGVVLVLRARRWYTGTVLLVFGVVFTALTILLLIPHFNPHHQFDYWSKLPGGEHPHLWQVLSGPFTRLTVWKTVGWLLGIVGFLALRSPLLVLALPTLAWRFGSANPMFWGPDWHYNATLMPILFLALVDAVARIRRAEHSVLKGFAEGMVPASLGIAVACTVSLPVGLGGLADPGAWSGGEHAAALRAAIAQIPPNVRVEASMAPLARLAARDDAYWLGGAKQPAPDYLCIDLAGWAGGPTDLPGYGAALHPGSTYKVVFSRDQVVVLQRQ
ncbi:DUF2079 domain-containing protein [Kitasatospora sp. NBC_01250]|uniref:DUF2079 domain-containing protein n=1 Tax=unclassified Kitasatospora TaxID=2633591 RepID=UPI002E1620A2|nr:MULTISPECIES: DUF2079 domain-containing protein [unclassified Kitasatospora]WSJ69786.1 DUF2079 domain-containing protein [Kitasatospora sp. NBC_01302]